MYERGDLQVSLRQIVDAGGGICDLARFIRTVPAEGCLIQAGAAMRDEFGLTIEEVLNVLAWAEGSNDDEGLDQLRGRIRTPLR